MTMNRSFSAETTKATETTTKASVMNLIPEQILCEGKINEATERCAHSEEQKNV